MCSLERHLALHIENLEKGLRETNRAEDRPKFEKLLACAACLLSKVILNSSEAELFQSIEDFDRLWSYTWLEGTWKPGHSESFEKFKLLAGYPGRGRT